MRRLLAITLVLLFGVPLITPLFALGTEGHGKLLACCRRDGAHHCQSSIDEMADAMADSQGTQLMAPPSRCGAFPRAVSPSDHHDLSFDSASLLFAGIVSHPAMQHQTEARARVALDRARQKRGPPSLRIS